MALPQTIETLKNIPIPDLGKVREQRTGARLWALDREAPQSGELLVDVDLRGVPHYAHAHNPPYYEIIPGSVSRLYVRTSIKETLHRINDELRSAGLELYIYDAWRTQATQSYCRDVWFYDYLKRAEPLWSDEQIRDEIGKYWAAGPRTEVELDPSSPPPHATGGVVDLTIAFVGGEPLWMGTIFDDVSVAAHTDYLEQHLPIERSFTYEEGLRNRRLLYWTMTHAGFEVNPNEWWHFSWGDQFWAKIQSWRHGTKVAAHYSAATPADWNSRLSQ
jgi:D-alanyl-D-alanine dipeptidase